MSHSKRCYVIECDPGPIDIVGTEVKVHLTSGLGKSRTARLIEPYAVAVWDNVGQSPVDVYGKPLIASVPSRELKRQAIRDWLTAEGAYNQMPNGGSVESESNSPINEVLVDGYVDFEKLLDRLERIR